MNKTLERIFIFITGGAIGAGTTWMALKNYYETKTRNDVESVKRRYKSDEKEEDTKDEKKEHQPVPTAHAVNKPDLTEYVSILKESGYVDYTDASKAKPVKEENMKGYPTVIPPNQFGDREDYEIISLTYFSDGVLVDDGYEIISDVESIVGHDSLEHFGEYEDDCVYVQNDILKNYYEILRDERTYADLLDDKPHLVKES